MNELDPAQTILQLAGGYCVPRSLHVVADLGVADHLDDSPRTAVELASAVGANEDALGRVLRLLAAHGVFEAKGDRFAHSPASRLLRSDHPRSLRALARMFGLSPTWQTFGAMDHSVRTGLPAAEKALPGGFWRYFEENPDAGAIFDAAMMGKAYGQVGAVVASYDFSPFRIIADIGGGRGHLLRAILDAAPNARGVLFDLPQVVAQADTPSERLSIRGGDFFRDTLPSCDAYLVMEVIHDWADEPSVAILRAIRKAAPAGAKLLVIEQLVPSDPGPHWSKMLDVHMLTLLGGRQRTKSEYESLLRAGGFALEREIDTGADIAILEARPV